MVLGPSRGSAGKEGEETSGSENETRLVAAEPPRCEPGGLPRRCGLPAVQAFRGLTATNSSRDLTVVEQLKGWNQATPTNPDEGGGEQLGWQLAGQIGARIVPSQRRCRNLFDNGVN
jgi:hypothetical protein